MGFGISGGFQYPGATGIRLGTRHSRNGIYGTWRARSNLLGLDVRRPDHFAPLLGFVSDELAEVRRRTSQQCTAEVDQPCLKFRIVETSVDLFVELADDLGGRGLRCADAEPGARLVAGQDLADRRNIWQFLQAC